jgi:arginine deiminase
MGGKLSVTSEIGVLRRVIVHSPGSELLAVTPSTRRKYLYDDIIDLQGAQEEHRRFTSILRRFCDVYEVRELLEAALERKEAREFLLTRSEEVTAVKTLTKELGDLSPRALTERFIEGWRHRPGPFSEALEAQVHVVPPLPNLFFTRDSSVVVGEGVVIASMRFLSRWPEEAVLRTIFGFHPALEGSRILYDGSDERRHDNTVEGGDLHVLSPETVLVGISERTTVAALDELTEAFFADGLEHVIAVVLPQQSTAIHLDMVWTQLDRKLCAVHPPYFRGPTRVPVLYRRKGKKSVTEPSSIWKALKNVGLPMEPVFCGGSQRDTQEREQWMSGCNFFAVAPGQVLSYNRNEQTLRSMEESGFRIIEGESLLLGDDEVRDDEQTVITIQASELVRGGGGPRCMTCPIWRKDVD